jgi:hypothetical protein
MEYSFMKEDKRTTRELVEVLTGVEVGDGFTLEALGGADVKSLVESGLPEAAATRIVAALELGGRVYETRNSIIS